MNFGLSIIFMVIWAGLWIKYSWGKPFKVFLQVGVISALIPLSWLAYVGALIVVCIAFMSFSYIVGKENIYVPDAAWSAFQVVIAALILGVGLLTIYIQDKVSKKLKEF
jgi:hypothetical protein